jgi:hypothetical protein
MSRRRVTSAIGVACGIWMSACSGSGGTGSQSPPVSGGSGSSPSSAAPTTGAVEAGPYSPLIDPAQFSTTIDNPLYPLTPGTRLVYEGRTEDGLERDVVEVTRDTRTVMGVTCVVVHDTATLNGKLIEDTYDWFAQDREGTVWYFGEDTRGYSHGKSVSTAGSWEGGVKGAQPGVVMKAHPQIGDTYRQEYYKGEAEDEAKVVSLTERATVPAGTYDNVLATDDYTRLEPGVVERKYYAPGVGLVLDSEGSDERIELIRIEHV